MILSLFAGCGGSSGGGGGGDGSAPSDGSVPGAGSGTLTGSQAFPVGHALMQNGNGHESSCDGKPIPAGLTPTVGIAFLQQGLPDAVVCSTTGAPDAGSGSLVEIQVATEEWAKSETLTQSLTPGTYDITDEYEDDEDLCMLGKGAGTAILILGTQTSCGATSIAMSGTITIDSIDSGGVKGSFDVKMGDAYGHPPDGGAPLSLAGTFNATPCP